MTWLLFGAAAVDRQLRRPRSSGWGAGVTAAVLLGCASGAWAQPAEQPGRSVTAKKPPERAAISARKPATISVRCKYVDFKFSPDGDTADVVDRNFSDAVVTTVADLRSSPGSFVLTWERKMGTIIGLRVLRYRYLINRETGRADAQTSDEIDGTTPGGGSREEQCAIAKGST